MKITKLIEEMTTSLMEIKDDAHKFEIQGNNLAGSRVRKVMQTIKVQAQEVRVLVQSIKNERKGK